MLRIEIDVWAPKVVAARDALEIARIMRWVARHTKSLSRGNFRVENETKSLTAEFKVL